MRITPKLDNTITTDIHYSKEDDEQWTRKVKQLWDEAFNLGKVDVQFLDTLHSIE